MMSTTVAYWRCVPLICMMACIAGWGEGLAIRLDPQPEAVAVVPTAGSLEKIAAHGPAIEDLLASYVPCGSHQRGEALAYFVVRDQFTQRCHRADSERVA